MSDTKALAKRREILEADDVSAVMVRDDTELTARCDAVDAKLGRRRGTLIADFVDERLTDETRIDVLQAMIDDMMLELDRWNAWGQEVSVQLGFPTCIGGRDARLRANITKKLGARRERRR